MANIRQRFNPQSNVATRELEHATGNVSVIESAATNQQEPSKHKTTTEEPEHSIVSPPAEEMDPGTKRLTMRNIQLVGRYLRQTLFIYGVVNLGYSSSLGLFFYIENFGYYYFLRNIPSEYYLFTSDMILVYVALVFVNFIQGVRSIIISSEQTSKYLISFITLNILQISAAAFLLVFGSYSRYMHSTENFEAYLREELLLTMYDVDTWKKWDFLQSKSQCCGVESYKDWKNVFAEQEIKEHLKRVLNSEEIEMVLPESCCTGEWSCHLQPHNQTTYSQGCLDLIVLRSIILSDFFISTNAISLFISATQYVHVLVGITHAVRSENVEFIYRTWNPGTGGVCRHIFKWLAVLFRYIQQKIIRRRLHAERSR